MTVQLGKVEVHDNLHVVVEWRKGEGYVVLVYQRSHCKENHHLHNRKAAMVRFATVIKRLVKEESEG